MSHRTIASAWAIALVIAATLPAALASHQPPYVRVVSPGEGEMLRSDGIVGIEYRSDGHEPVARLDVLLGDVVVASGQGVSPVLGSSYQEMPLRGAANLSRGTYTLTARLVGMNNTSVVSPPVSVLLNHPPTPLVNATYDADASVLRIHGEVADDAGPVTLLLSTPLGNATLEAAGAYAHEQTGFLRAGTHIVTVVARDSDGAEVVATARAFVPDHEADFDILNVTAERGELLHVHGRVSDLDGPVTGVWLSTPFGNASSRVVDGMFWIDMPMRAKVGVHTATLTSKDPSGGASDATLTFEVAGKARVFFEEDFTLGPGAYANVAVFALPARSYGEVRVCTLTNATCGQTANAGAVLVEFGDSALDPWSKRCSYAPFVATACGFDARVDGTFGRASWALGGAGRVRISVTGYELT